MRKLRLPKKAVIPDGRVDEDEGSKGLRSRRNSQSSPSMSSNPAMMSNMRQHTPDESAPWNDAILFFGVTGSGKSTFISHLTEDEIEVGHGLESHTAHATIHRISSDTGLKIRLIDTPGFDDTRRSNVEILEEIAWMLGLLHGAGVRVRALVYMHRISDPRMGGSGVRSLRIFEAMCGFRSGPNVLFVTTMWQAMGESGEETGAARLQDLLEKDGFWGKMIRRGASHLRHDGSLSSANRIFQAATAKPPGCQMKLQREFLVDMVPLVSTAVGQFLCKEVMDSYEKLQAELSESRESLSCSDQEDPVLTELIQQQEAELEAVRQAATQIVGEMDVTFKDLYRDREHRSSTFFGENESQEDEITLLKQELEALRKKNEKSLRERDDQKERADRLESDLRRRGQARTFTREPERKKDRLSSFWEFARGGRRDSEARSGSRRVSTAGTAQETSLSEDAHRSSSYRVASPITHTERQPIVYASLQRNIQSHTRDRAEYTASRDTSERHVLRAPQRSGTVPAKTTRDLSHSQHH